MSVITREAPKLRRAARTALARYRPAALQLAAALGAFLAAGAPLFGGLRPLGLCAAACAAPGYALCAAAGAALGYLRALSVSDAAAYIAAVAAVALLRLIGGPARYEDAPMASACAGAVCLCLIRAGLSIAAGAGFTGVLSAAAEALLIMGMSYLLTAFFAAPLQVLDASDSESRAAACLALMAALACLTPYAALGLRAARIAGALAVLVTAWRRGSVAATLPGVAAAAVLCAADPASTYAGIGIAVGGLAAGLFLPEGRMLTAMVFCGAGFLGVLCAPSPRDGLLLMAELVCASVCFLLLPARWLSHAPCEAGTPAARAACATLAGRLETLSGALSSVESTVRCICEKLPPKTETYADLCDAVAHECCRACPKNTVCWVECGSDTYDCFNQMAPAVRSGRAITIADLPPVLLRRCSVPAKLAGAINAAQTRQAARRGLYSRSAATRAALCEQYAALAATLSALAGQVALEELPDRRKMRRLAELFRDAGLVPLDVSVGRDTAGRLHGAILLPHLSLSSADLSALAKEISELCRQPLELRQRQDGPTTTLLFEQQPAFSAEFGVCSVPAQGELSADAVQTCAGQGWAHAVLCDGMGTGKAAAVDGMAAAALAAQLVEAGFGQAEAARLVNVALALKSDDETATTLDVASADLYTGEVHLFKAGAAPSFLIHGQTVSVHGAPSLPIGILAQVNGTQSRLVLAQQDTLVLVSDGVIAAQDAEWVASQLVLNACRPPQELADALAQLARRRAERADDITVVALRLVPRPLSPG